MRGCFLAALALIATAADSSSQVEPTELLSIPAILKTPRIADFAVEPNGERVALSISFLGKEAIWMMTGENMAGAPVAATETSGERDVDWSPDGSALTFVSNRDGDWHVYVFRFQDKTTTQLTSGLTRNIKPRWSPDGKHIVFLSRPRSPEDGAPDDEETDGWDLWVVAAAGGEPARLTSEPFDEENPRWSPDGNRILFGTGGGRHQDRSLATVSAQGGAVEPLLPEGWSGDSHSAIWSHRGSQVTFVSDQPGRNALFTISSSGEAAPEMILDVDLELTDPAWSPDGRYLAYIENADGNLRLKLHDTKGDRPRTLTLGSGVHRQPVWRSDGKTVLALSEAPNYPRDVWSYSVDGGRERVSNTLPPELDVRKMLRPELVRFESFDKREITGYLYAPEGASPERPVPLLVRPHGGPSSQWTNGWHPFTQFLAQQGYAVFAPNVRGSTGFGVEFERLNDGEWGRGDLEDLITGARTIAARPEIRDDRMCLWGVSYGGFLTLAAITRYPTQFTCAVESVGMPDLEKLYRETTAEGRFYLEREIGPLRGNLQLYRQLSPIRDVDRVQTPLLSFHGEVYPLVPYSTKRPFFDALRQRPTYPLLEFIFRGAEARATYRHDLYPQSSYAYLQKILDFIEIYL